MTLIVTVELGHVPFRCTAESDFLWNCDTSSFLGVKETTVDDIESRSFPKDGFVEQIAGFRGRLRDSNFPTLESLEPECEKV